MWVPKDDAESFITSIKNSAVDEADVDADSDVETGISEGARPMGKSPRAWTEHRGPLKRFNSNPGIQDQFGSRSNEKRIRRSERDKSLSEKSKSESQIVPNKLLRPLEVTEKGKPEETTRPSLGLFVEKYSLLLESNSSSLFQFEYLMDEEIEKIIGSLDANSSVTDVHVGNGFSDVGFDLLMDSLMKKKNQIQSLWIDNPLLENYEKLLHCFLKDNTVLQSLRLNNIRKFGDHEAKFLGIYIQNMNLTDLDFCGCQLTNTGVTWVLSALGSIPDKIKRLNFGKSLVDCSDTTFGEILKERLSSGVLQDLNLSGIDLSHLDPNVFKKSMLSTLTLSSTCPPPDLLVSFFYSSALTYLDLSGVHFSMDHNLSRLLSNANLSGLILKNSTFDDIDGILDGLANNITIQKLVLANVQIWSDCRGLISFIRNNTSLVELNLKGCGLKKVFNVVEAWCNSERKLTYFNLGKNEVGIKSSAKIAQALTGNDSLRFLGLANCNKLTNEGIKMILDVLNNEQHILETLDISGINMTSDGIARITRGISLLIEFSPSITHLKLNNIKCDEDILNELAAVVCSSIFVSKSLKRLQISGFPMKKYGKSLIRALQFHPLDSIEIFNDSLDEESRLRKLHIISGQ
eukprot:TRINITY_DN24972_c0_g1_i2.p1 TRINITY_DN24972_c0_g1~~TRINITY_DN24972_c0_g1_i2.p1  ORF type:complete len:715 (-),score=131.05 TRINITY_DN24972_c0_g1_i2:715-2610(-)